MNGGAAKVQVHYCFGLRGRLRGSRDFLFDLELLDQSGFLKSASKALRAALGLRGVWPLEGVGAGAEGDESLATVTRSSNSVHSLALSFTGILTGMGFKHWKRVEGSK